MICSMTDISIGYDTDIGIVSYQSENFNVFKTELLSGLMSPHCDFMKWVCHQ